MEAKPFDQPVVELTQEQIIQDIHTYATLILADGTNDFFMMPFMNIVMKLVDAKGVLTNKGILLLHQDINGVMEKIKEGCGDRDRVRAGLYFTICLNLGLIYISFVRCLEEDEHKHYKTNLETNEALFDTNVYELMLTVANRIETLLPTFRLVLNNELPKLSEKYAKLFDTEKRASFTKDIFKHEPLYIRNNDLPEDIHTAKEVPTV